MVQIKVSVVIPTYNRVNSLTTILNGLINQNLPTDDYEVIFVNDGSPDNTQEALPLLIERLNQDRKALIRMISQENQGQAVARNNGAKAAKGDVLVFLDDDMEPCDETFLEHHLIHHENQSNLVVFGAILPPANDPKRPPFEWFYEKSIESMYQAFDGGLPPSGQHFFSANVSVDRQLFLKAGGFDRDYRHAEDRELGLRLEARFDAEFKFDRKASAYHNSTTGKFKSFIHRAQLYGSYDYQMSLKYPQKVELSPFFFIVAQNPFKTALIATAERSQLATNILTKILTVQAIVLGKLNLRKMAAFSCSAIYIMNYVSSLKQFLSQKELKTQKQLDKDYEAAKESYLESLGRQTGRSFFRDMKLDMKYILEYEGRNLSVKNVLWLLFGSDAYPILLLFRLRKLARKYRLPLVNRILRQVQTVLYSIELGIDIELGHGVYFVHSLGTVVGGTSVVGNKCVFMGNNTVGAAHRYESPVIESGVVVGAGARILGEIRVGQSSTIGANSVVLKDIPPQSIAVGSPAKVVKSKAAREKESA
ncbi:serine O-acetyltransferase EpsC [Pseudobacteriovorax antillogorgiicola]|uniref:Serine acetyltransferase n=1 Tax=Pseudobacteriovorax antillogorgiicola TaxID=1513793 RepID=A0A1Y6BPI5_9BACT|nr:serine O-acetyltransferase EpsC [Pseudobacteriovorax antillogorgiicola]TCS54544.1 serine acetyltransferase [Pseudobacteriovorax antillogorgiicola]SMF18551.1 Serine acetyltransferase [Pseudobacteriovorax antillogorgiicola]